ncbi:MAG: hypothetical protein JWN76_1961 [Chitinophagaceae bacterium]|nr:hypothetical protein [Chitinophagaceae bacterium]
MFLIAFSADLVQAIGKYSGFVGILFLFLYGMFSDTINKRFFNTLTQKRKVFMLSLTPILVWSTGVLVIVLSYLKNNPEPVNKHFFFQGQIINEKGEPLSNATAYIILKSDTIRAVAPTGNDGNFTIALDTLEGIKTTLYYAHPEYTSNTAFRALNSSTFEQFILKSRKTPPVKTQQTFFINIKESTWVQALQKKTGLKQTFSNPTYEISIVYDEKGIENFDNRCRYLGGKAQVFINHHLCCESAEPLPPTHSLGTNRQMLEKQLEKMVQATADKEKDQLIANIARCIGA